MVSGRRTWQNWGTWTGTDRRSWGTVCRCRLFPELRSILRFPKPSVGSADHYGATGSHGCLPLDHQPTRNRSLRWSTWRWSVWCWMDVYSGSNCRKMFHRQQLYCEANRHTHYTCPVRAQSETDRFSVFVWNAFSRAVPNYNCNQVLHGYFNIHRSFVSLIE